MIDLAEVILRLGGATLIGTAIGLNRDLRGKPIGVRTSDKPYRWKIEPASLEKVANHEKKLPKNFMKLGLPSEAPRRPKIPTPRSTSFLGWWTY